MSTSNTKKWYISKTVWVNVLSSLAGATALTEYVPDEWTPIVLTIVGVANVILRVWFTNTSLEK